MKSGASIEPRRRCGSQLSADPLGGGTVSRFVRLYEQAGLALVVEAPTGVVYSNQTGGYSCLQPELEGALIPLRNDVELPSKKLLSPEHELCDYFEGPPHKGTGAVRGLSGSDADVIDGVLDKWRIPWVRVDRERLEQSHEAWVHVLVSPEPSDTPAPLFRGFEPYPARAVLTWCNSD